MSWVNISDGFPEADQDVFYFFATLGVYKGKYRESPYPEEFGVDEDGNQYIGHTFFGKCGFLTDDVTHWMPAPTDEDWDEVLPDIPDDYVEVYDPRFKRAGLTHKDNAVMVEKDRFDSVMSTWERALDGRVFNRVCPDDDCPCHIYWYEEDDGYKCGGCGTVYPSKEVEDNHVKYRSKYDRPCPICNPYEEEDNYKGGFLGYSEGVEPHSTEHLICDKCDSTYTIDEYIERYK